MWNLSDLPSRRSAPARHLFSEDELAEAWEQRAYAARYLVDCCGRHLRVVFPGRRWGGPGPDFVGALLALADGTLLRGDVEVHRRASSWAAHRHARDASYAGVVLHVVQESDALALDARGQHLPTVALEPEPGQLWAARRWWQGRTGGQLRAQEPVPCVREAASVLEIVDAAGRERLLARVARFEGDLAVAEPEQVLWRGVAEALGYQRNTQPFGQLAEAVPWAQAAQLVADRGPVGLAGALLGAAGLIAEATLPEAHAWRALQRTQGLRPALSKAGWDRRQVRAANAPEERCRGLAELAARWCQGLAEERRSPAEQVLEAVRQAAAARRPVVWRQAHAPPWIGRGRAQVVAINVLLPFAAAAGVGEAVSLFERLPGEPSNRVVRYMARQLGGGTDSRFRGACRQQGLLQLFKQSCAGRWCERCPAYAASPGATSWASGPSKGG